jgi:hypothetical protein
VEGEGLAFVYGRVHPPADAAEGGRLPGFLVALGKDGPVGYATDVTIEETDTASSAQPGRIVVSGRGDSLALTLDMAVDQVTTTRMGARSFGSSMNFLQLRGSYRVFGRAGDRKIEFTGPGSAETFRGR